MEPLFDGGEYAGAIQYVTSYFDLPDNGTLSLEQVDMMPSNPDARPVILLRGPNANLVP
jgi:ABC-type thiamine transport system ATPase subunit